MKYHILIITVTSFIFEVNAVCRTPNNQTGEITCLYDCPILLEALRNQQTKFVRDSSCGCSRSGDPLVCCALSSPAPELKPISSTQETPIPARSNGPAKINLLPSRKFCGFQHYDDYFHTHNATEINEFPWLVDLNYKSNNPNFQYSKGKEFKCSGSVITNRYVLTAAFCAVHKAATVVGIRLGEFNIRNDTDCQYVDDINECSDPVEDVGIEKIIPHPNYDDERPLAYNIALLRMNKTIAFTDYIRPICLPIPPFKDPDAGETVFSSGWGFLNLTRERTDAKKRSLNSVISTEECAEKLKRFPSVVITDSSLCTIHDANSEQFQCIGDGGGPVMFTKNFQWYQVAIVGLGIGTCSSRYPDINIRVATYMEWITENLEP